MSVVRRALRARWAALAVVLGVAAAAAVVVPVFGSENPDVDVLRMTDVDGDFVVHVDDSGAATSQTLTTKNCVIQDDGPLLAFDSSDRGPGIFDHGMGVKSGGAKGTPCSETDASEWLTISAADGQAWYKLRLDVEAKGDARIEVTLSNEETHVLVTGSSIMDAGLPVPDLSLPYSAETNPLSFIAACADPSDSGPDSKINDNCLWTIESASPFNSLTIGTTTGSVSLEGGNDYLGTSYSDTADQEFASLFFRAGPPTANDDVGDDGYSVDEDSKLTVPPLGVLANDEPVFGDLEDLSASLVTGPSNGMLCAAEPCDLPVDPADYDDIVHMIGTDGSFVYVPFPDFDQIDSFTYVATEGGQQSDPATVMITVNPINDNPVPIPGPLPGLEDEQGFYTGEDLATDVDVGDSLTIVPGSGSAENGTFEDPDGDDQWIFTPDPDFCGEASITFDVSDDGDDPLAFVGGPATVTVNVACGADDDSYEMDDRELISSDPLVTDLVTLEVFSPAEGVLANDTLDPGSDGVTAVKVSDPIGEDDEQYGTVDLDPNDGTFSYTQDATKPLPFGDDSTFTLTWRYKAVYDPGVREETKTVAITVFRTLCLEDSVETDSTLNVYGKFTLIKFNGCKRWPDLTADQDAGTVLFVPPVQINQGVYDGELVADNVEITGTSPDGPLSEVFLLYDPDGEGTEFGEVPIPSCLPDPIEGYVHPDGPGDAEDPGRWCFYDVDPVLTGVTETDPPKPLWTITWKVRGWDDPGFRFR